MAISRAALTAEFTNMNFGFGPSALEQALINSYADQTSIAGGLTDEQARLAVTQLVGDTTAVAGLTYQFFTGRIPSEAGFYFLVNSEGNGDLNPNPNDLNDPYYASFNQENRYYNFALNLSRPGGEGATAFAATYGGLSNADAVFLAYENIVGTAAAIEAGIDPNAARADILGRFTFFRQIAIERGGIANTPANQAAIDLAAKAVMVAYLLNEAFKASVGNLVDSFERFLLDIGEDGDAEGAVDGNGYGDDVIAAYPGADDVEEFTLTPGADAGTNFTGGSGDDVFFATEDTLTSTDILNGGAGDDTLIIATSGSSDVVLAGFDTESIEEFQLTSDADSTRLDVSGAEDLERIINTNSSSDVTLTGMVPTIDVTIENTTQENGGGSVNTTIQYVASATAGDNTRQQITLVNVIDPVDEDGQTRIDLIGNADNVEIVDLIAVGENILTYLDSPSLDEVNVTGTGDLTVEGVGFDAATNVFNATNLQGDLDVTFDTSGVNDVVATGGEGDDRFDYQAGFDQGDSVTGGAGSDLLVVNVDTGIEQGYTDNGDAANAARGTAAGVEVVTLAAGVFDDTINLANLGTALTTLNINTEVDGTVTLANLLSTTTVVINHNLADLDGDELIVDFVGDGSSDELNLTINNLGGASGDGTLTLSDDTGAFGVGDNDSLNTLDLVINDDAAGGELVLSLNDLDELTTWNIAGNADLDADSGAGDTGALVTVNGSTSTGNINLTDVTFSASVLNGAGISITTGSGNDEIGNAAGSIAAASLIGNDTINTGAGADLVYSGLGNDTVNLGDGADEAHGMQGNDTINGGAGDDDIWGNFGLDTLTGGTGADTFHYVNILDSQGVTVDVITDFVSGTDTIDLLEALQLANPLVIDASDVVFVGNATTFGNAVTALSGGGGVEAVFVQNANPGVPGAGILYVDVNGDGNIDTNDDMAIQLNGVSSITAADIQATFLPITFTSFAPGFDTDQAATSVEGTTTTDESNDVVNTTFANLAGSTADGGADVDDNNIDVLNITDAINVPVDLDTYADIENFDRLNLRGGTTALVTAPSIDELTINIGPAGGIVATDGGVGIDQTVNGSNTATDQVTLNGSDDVANTRGGNDNVTIANIDFDGSVDGGAGTDDLDLADGADISDATITGIETVTLADDATISQAQNEAFTGANMIAAGGNNTVTIIGGGTVNADTDVETYNGDGSAQFFFADNSVVQDFNLGGGDDTLYYFGGAGAFAAGVDIDGGTGNDRLNIGDSYGTFDISNASSINSIEVLEIDNAVMTGAQHAIFTTIEDWLAGADNNTTITISSGAVNDTLFSQVEFYNLTASSDTVTVVTGNESVALGDGNNIMSSNSSTADVSAGTGVDTFNLNNGTANGTYTTGAGTDDVNFSGTVSNVSVNTGADNDTIDFSGTTVSGLALDGGGGTNVVSISTGVTITSSTFTNIADANLVGGDGPYSFDVGTWANIDGIISDAQQDETIIFTNSGGVVALTADLDGEEVENYVLASGNDTFTIDLAGLADVDYDVDISSGGTDTINLNNSVYNANTLLANLDITGFTAGVGGDLVNWDNAGQNIGLTFQTVGANSNSIATGGAGALIEVSGASVNTAGSIDVAADGTVEGVIAAALGDMTQGTFAAGDDIGVILYDASGNAYLYSVDLTAVTANLVAADITVELVGTITNVGVGGLDGSNFI